MLAYLVFLTNIGNTSVPVGEYFGMRSVIWPDLRINLLPAK